MKKSKPVIISLLITLFVISFGILLSLLIPNDGEVGVTYLIMVFLIFFAVLILIIVASGFFIWFVLFVAKLVMGKEEWEKKKWASSAETLLSLKSHN